MGWQWALPWGAHWQISFLAIWRPFKQPSSTHPKTYLPCVEDVLAAFNDDKKCDSFLNILNTQHKNL